MEQQGDAVEAFVGRAVRTAAAKSAVEPETATAVAAAAVDRIVVGAEVQSAADVGNANPASCLSTTESGSMGAIAVATAAAADIDNNFVDYLVLARCAHAAECSAATSSTSFEY